MSTTGGECKKTKNRHVCLMSCRCLKVKVWKSEDSDLNAKHNAARHMPMKHTSIFVLVSNVKAQHTIMGEQNGD